MNLLLDTHVFIWWSGISINLPKGIIREIRSKENTIILSVVSIWEIQIKLQLEKLRLNVSLKTLLETQQEKNDLQILKVDLSHVLELDNLPFYHKDPFDRLIVAQAKVEDLSLVSGDKIFLKYPVNVLW